MTPMTVPLRTQAVRGESFFAAMRVVHPIASRSTVSTMRVSCLASELAAVAASGASAVSNTAVSPMFLAVGEI